jgi:hypothetical protein
MATERMPEQDATTTWSCPACGTRSLVDHCQSPTCTWHRCRNTGCDLVADFKTGRGHRLPLVANKRTRWVK